MNRRLLYIVNPISGTGNKKSTKDIIHEKTSKAGFEYSIYPSVESGDYSFLHPIIKEQKVTDVVIAGGDGTINKVINSLRKLNVQFGIIPCGSGNGLAFSANIPKNTSKALDIIFQGKAEWSDAFLINKSFACMLCGLGLDAKVAHDFADDPKRGLLTYIKKTISNFFTSKAYHFDLELKEKRISTEAFFISIANSNQFGNHFTIAPKAILTDGLIDIVVMTKQNKLSVLYEAIKQVGGFNEVKKEEWIDEESNLLYFQTDELIIYNSELAPMHIDGDPVETQEKLHIRLLKKSFKLIFP